jgi:Transcriptional regulator containing PAS, AAA-type ATPase, and DNA-binding domains
LEQGKNYDNIETFIQNERVEGRYLASGRAIKDDDGYSAGAVLTIKDYKKAKELADIVISSEDDQFKDIIGNSNAIYNLKKIAKAVAKSDSTILIRGESGTGKELFARAIKNLSQRENQRFITINCAAIPDSLIESELFGYEKGSFTGALNSGKLGLFKEADKGTLFLDEIGELSLTTQAKLLRVLQEGVVRRIGSSKEEKVDVRIICATHRNLEEMIRKRNV